ncbi:MAG: class I SAM-dependent methyltransferase [Actinomycetota bacterium]|nr:class I SAM-dependent methyltransferase [Actinomycetota bacterium]
MVAAKARGAVRSPNIWQRPDVYEVENRAVDPDGSLTAALRGIRDWAGADVLDVGCGTGFHLPSFAATAARVVGVEPHPGLAAVARRRCTGLRNVGVRVGAAQDLPLPSHRVDVAHARWAYFFGPGCEPGLRELARVMRRGGVSYVVDNDATRSTFGRWFRSAYPAYDAAAVERFWSGRGWNRRRVDMGWRFASREDLEAVLRIELPPAQAERALAEHRGLEVDYAVNVWWREW